MISTAVKFGIGAALLYGAYKWISAQGQKLANSFGFQMQGYDTPSVNWPNLDLPVKVQFTNPTSVALNIDNVAGAIYIDKGGWLNVANFSQPMSIPPGQNVVKINTRIDLGKIFGGNFLDTLKTAFAAYSNKAVNVRTDITVTYAGVPLPTQQFVKQIQVG